MGGEGSSVEMGGRPSREEANCGMLGGRQMRDVGWDGEQWAAGGGAGWLSLILGRPEKT